MFLLLNFEVLFDLVLTWFICLVHDKSCETVIPKYLARLTNFNFFPWSMSSKKGDKSSVANYRPISLTCILCKVLEHIMASHLVKHLAKHDLLYDLQHGFREKRSCETQLTMLFEYKQANWPDTAGLLGGFRQSKSLKSPLEAPSVWDQRKCTILDLCLPG